MEKDITDSDRLEWLVLNRALVHTTDRSNPDDITYFVVYRNEPTKYAYSSYRDAIDCVIKEFYVGN